MENMALEMFKMWKSSWESYVKTLQMMQEQGDKILDNFLTQSDAVREESKKMLREGMSNAQQAQKAYFQAVEENFNRFEELFGK
jgi:polyhydroxyalkanoate synthesis regulator phasin